MNFLVTGGAGFIGSHLCEKLLSLGYKVFCLDDFSDFYLPSIKRDNISKLSQNSKFCLLEGDLRNSEFLKNVFKQYRFDTIIHLAAMAGVRPSICNPDLYYDVNINGTLNLLSQISKLYSADAGNYPPDFIFASSSSVYGNNKTVPFSEDDPVDNPISPYAVTKKAGELMCYNYHHLYKIPMICLRLFTVFGPRQRPDLAIRKFAKLILNEEPIPVYGDGSSERDYTYIEDIIQGIVKSINYLQQYRGKKGKSMDSSSGCYEILNLGDSRTISLSKMITTLENGLGKKAIIKTLPVQPGDVKRTYASIDKSKRLLGYNPTCSFERGIELFIDWLLKLET